MNTEQERAELLPCPFCGAGKTEIREDRPWLGMRYGEPSSVSVRHWCEPIEGQPSRMIERVGRDRAGARRAGARSERRAGHQAEATRSITLMPETTARSIKRLNIAVLRLFWPTIKQLRRMALWIDRRLGGSQAPPTRGKRMKERN